jgi:hypothetical protein
MPAIDIVVAKNTFPELYQAAMRLLDPTTIHGEMAKVGKVLTQKHLLEIDAARSSDSGFYESYAQVTRSEADASSGRVIIPPIGAKASPVKRGNPISAHYWGYTFTQANLTAPGKYYTIPANDETRHRRAREFPDLVPVFRMLGGHLEAFALAEKNIYRRAQVTRGWNKGYKARKRKGEELVTRGTRAGQLKTAGRIMFWLIKGFILKADKSILPSPSEYREAARRKVEQLIQRVLRRRGLA